MTQKNDLAELRNVLFYTRDNLKQQLMSLLTTKQNIDEQKTILPQIVDACFDNSLNTIERQFKRILDDQVVSTTKKN